MPLEEQSEGDLQVIGIVIQSGRLSSEEVGFGTRVWEPTQHTEGNQIGGGVLTSNVLCSSGTCELSGGDCPHSLCLSFKATRPTTLEVDEYWDRGTIAVFGSFTVYPYFYYNGETEPPDPTQWIAGLAVSAPSLSIDIEVPMTPDDFFNNSHPITVEITKIDDTDYAVDVTVYDTSDSGTAVLIGSSYAPTSLFIGSEFASNIEPILICGIKLLTASVDEADFVFPSDSFTAAVGTGQEFSGGAVKITGDASSTAIGYRKELCDPPKTPYDLGCFPHCPDNLQVQATISDVEDCGCVAGDNVDGWKLNPSAVNGSFTLRRTGTSCGLDYTQWESDYPMGFPGALQHYNSVPDSTIGPCSDTHSACTSGEGGCGDVYSACVDACMGVPGCITACGEADTACISACDAAGNACADCFLFPGGESYPSCVCHDLDSGCECGAHMVVQCFGPTPSFPDTPSTVVLWVNRATCGTPAYVSCSLGCSTVYNDCIDTHSSCIHDCRTIFDSCIATCSGDPDCELSCYTDRTTCETACGTENTCFSAATDCESTCESYGYGCGDYSSGDVNVFSWTCDAGCSKASLDCQFECTQVDSACRATCEAPFIDCANACVAIHDPCVAGCMGDMGCIAACDADFTACGDACHATEDACFASCDSAESSCISGCISTETDCHSDCNTDSLFGASLVNTTGGYPHVCGTDFFGIHGTVFLELL